ncbi:MAG: M56 family metallopeptidase [Butyricicoccus sp.]
MLQFSEKLLNNLMQIGLTVSLAALVPLILRRLMKKRYPARMVCVVWAILALRLLIPVQLTLPQAPVQVMPRTSYVVQSDQTAFRQAGLPVAQNPTRWVTGTQAETLSAADTGTVKTVDITDILLALWLAGVIACVLWQGIGYYRLIRSLKGTSQPVERVDLHTILQEQCADLVIDREIPLRVSSAADCPMLAGFIHPTLYLPDERISRTDAAFIFRHELTHYKHGDLWLKLLLLAARCLHWFNPLVHLIARFAQEDIEAACDDAVVRGHDGAYRRAYGETILRSAIAQAQKRKALVSCFGDDKKTLMRRFEGLFDKSVKKRGVALVVMIALLVGSLSCTIAVGDRSTPQTTEERALLIANTFAQAYVDEDAEGFYKYLDPSSENAEGDTFSTGAAVYKRYTTRYEPETQTALIVYEYEWDADRAAAMGVQGVTTGVPYREAQRLHFTGKGDKMLISKAIWEADSDLTSSTGDDSGLVNSLEHFKLLYENDLGLPDFVSADNKAVIGNSDPVSAAEVLLGIAPAVSQVEGSDEESAPYNDIRKVTFTFKDNSKVVVTMINQFGQGWLPQDWTDGSGVRSRTAADLAQQYARAVLHKSAQYIFPILTPDGQKDLITQQMAMTGGEQWTWKYGPSSPSATDFVPVPADDESSYCVVFRLSGSGVNDARSAYIVQTIRENKNSSVIGDIRELSTDSSTQSELFRTYYATGLSWPDLPDEVGNFSGKDRLNAEEAAKDAFYYFGSNLEQDMSDWETPWISSTELDWQVTSTDGYQSKIVQLNFADGSTPIKIQMVQNDSGYWKPIGMVDSVTAKSREQELGVGADARSAMARGKMPNLAVGDKITFTFETEPVGGVEITNRLVNWEGGSKFGVIDEQITLQKSGDGWVYTVPTSLGEMLSSTISYPFYHAVTLEYTDVSHIQHKATAVYTSGSDSADENEDSDITSTAYYNDSLNYSLKLPQSFVDNDGYAKRNPEDDSILFGMKNAMGDASRDPTEDGAIMTLRVDATAVLHSEYGENWTKNYPSPVKQLAEKDGLTYYLAYVSDVQYDPSNQEIAAKYKEMFTAAQNITADDFVLDDLTDKDGTVRRARLLTSLGAHYAVLHMGAQHDQPYQVAVNTDNSSCEVYVSRIDWTTEAQYKVYAADRVTFKDITNTEPTTVEHLADSTQGLTAEQFDLLCSRLEFTLYSDSEQKTIQQTLQSDQTPEQGARAFLGLNDKYGRFDSDSEQIYGENNEFASITYRFTDPNTGKENGKYVKLTMHKATADSSLPVLWMPYSYELFTA